MRKLIVPTMTVLTLFGSASVTMACTTTLGTTISDAPGNASTTCNIPLATVNEDDSGRTDHDWYRVNLEAGKGYRIHSWCVMLNCEDTKLSLINPAGQTVATNDDASRFTKNSIISYLAPSSGVYFVDGMTKNSFSRYAVTRTLSVPAVTCRAGSITGFNRDTVHYGYLPRGNYFVEYCIAASKGMYMQYILKGKPGAADPVGSLYSQILDASNKVLENNIIGGNHRRNYGPFLKAGVYYLRVSAQYPLWDYGDFELDRAE